jgi:hypothetical protein
MRVQYSRQSIDFHLVGYNKIDLRDFTLRH